MLVLLEHYSGYVYYALVLIVLKHSFDSPLSLEHCSSL